MKLDIRKLKELVGLLRGIKTLHLQNSVQGKI